HANRVNRRLAASQILPVPVVGQFEKADLLAVSGQRFARESRGPRRARCWRGGVEVAMKPCPKLTHYPRSGSLLISFPMTKRPSPKDTSILNSPAWPRGNDCGPLTGMNFLDAMFWDESLLFSGLNREMLTNLRIGRYKSVLSLLSPKTGPSGQHIGTNVIPG